MANCGNAVTRNKLTLVVGSDDRSQAGQQIAGLGSIHDIHVLNRKRDALQSQFCREFVAVGVLTVENGEILPLAAQLAMALADGSNQFGGLDIVRSKHHSLNRKIRESFAQAEGFLFARGQ